jgi:hypothetical protein
MSGAIHPVRFYGVDRDKFTFTIEFVFLFVFQHLFFIREAELKRVTDAIFFRPFSMFPPYISIACIS